VTFGIEGAGGCDAVVRHSLHPLVRGPRRRPIGGRIAGRLLQGQGPVRIRCQLLPCTCDAPSFPFFAGALEGRSQQGALITHAAVVCGWSRTGGCRLASDFSPLLASNVASTVPLLAQTLDQIGQIAVAEVPYSWMAGLLYKLMLVTAQQPCIVPAGA